MRGRFAPTPSGVLHVGNAWVALLAWLQVRQSGGQFLLRMEDIDKQRSRPDLARKILADLRWLGLDWDEGPDVGGPHAPYVQSEREELYRAALERLITHDNLYPCYCTRTELQAIASAPHGLGVEGPQYPGTCLRLTRSEAEAKAATGRRPSLRFAMPVKPTTFIDLIAGQQRFENAGDFVVMRSDDIFAYQLAVVVDDAAMGITHVLRGWDLLDSTPRQIRLYEALGLPTPTFAHVPLLLGPDGQRLAKRHGSVTIAGMRDAGTAAAVIVGQLAYLSGLIDRPEPLRAADLIAHFSMDCIPSAAVILSADLLATLNGQTR